MNLTIEFKNILSSDEIFSFLSSFKIEDAKICLQYADIKCFDHQVDEIKKSPLVKEVYFWFDDGWKF